MESKTQKEIYLTVQICGKHGMRMNAWKNEKKNDNSNEPDYKGDGIAIWKNTKKDEPKQEEI